MHQRIQKIPTTVLIIYDWILRSDMTYFHKLHLTEKPKNKVLIALHANCAVEGCQAVFHPFQNVLAKFPRKPMTLTDFVYCTLSYSQLPATCCVKIVLYTTSRTNSAQISCVLIKLSPNNIFTQSCQNCPPAAGPCT